MEEINRLRKQASEQEYKFRHNDQDISDLKHFEKSTKHSLTTYEKWISKLQESTNNLEFDKKNNEEYNKEKKSIDELIDTLKQENINHKTHIAMVENYIEKYLPLNVQKQIGAFIRTFLTEEQLDRI